MIEVQSLSKRFAEKKVFDGITLNFSKEETVFVLGKSGVGKSVLLKHLVGLLKPDEGKVVVDGEDLTEMDEIGLTRIRKKCGLVFQFPALLDSLTVFENVSFGVFAHRLATDESDVESRVLKAMGLVDLNSEIFNRYPPELSFGVQKRVAIARTLAIEPEYLLFDEPTTSLDPVITRTINQLIQGLRKELKVGAIVVSHDLESAFQIGDRLILLEEGRAVLNGTKEDFLASEIPLARAFVKESEVVC